MKRSLILTLTIFLAACQSQTKPTHPVAFPSETIPLLNISAKEAEITPLKAIGLTYHSPDGNRLVNGKGDLPNSIPIDIPLNGIPVWLVAVSTQEGSLWAAVLDDGRIQAFHVVDRNYTPVELSTNDLPIGTPPLLTFQNGNYSLMPPIVGIGSLITHPIPLTGTFSFSYINGTGRLVFENPRGRSANLPTNALPDARILVEQNERLLFLSSPTTKYNHGITGDGF